MDLKSGAEEEGLSAKSMKYYGGLEMTRTSDLFRVKEEHGMTYRHIR